jgi:methylenetetrahydrofolate dehydrogenase (NADP+) / methenyltetrahydrofolate cyclohydrolase
MNKILDGKKVSAELFLKLKPRVDALKLKNVYPKLVFLIVGKNPASQSYVAMKKKASENMGIISEIISFKDNISQNEVLHKINLLNNDKNVHGIMIQLPLPQHIDVHEVTKAIIPGKDADGLNPLNIGETFNSKNKESLPPATALGITKLLEHYNVNLEGINAIVLGRSLLAGKSIGAMLTNRNATVTLCHSKTKDIAKHCKNADLIVAATGIPHLVKEGWVNNEAIVIDAGYNSVDGKTVGDVDFDNVIKKCKLITPVPGGCGPMTIYGIIENTINAAEGIVKEKEQC